LSHESEIKTKRLTVLYNEYKNCVKCDLHQSRSNIVFGLGNPESKIVIIAESPSDIEEQCGYPLIGPMGKILDFLLAKAYGGKYSQFTKSFPLKRLDQYNWDWKDFEVVRRELIQDIFYTNVVLCKPPENRNPYLKEIKACNDRLKETIYTVDPYLIITVGKVALETLVGRKMANISKSINRIMDIKFTGRVVDIVYPILPILHPAILLKTPDVTNKDGLWGTTISALRMGINLVEERKLIGTCS